MARNPAYHQSAIIYNERLAEAAEELAPTIEDEEVRKSCTSVGKQHRFHAKRHRSALNKLLTKQEAAPVEQIPDGLDVPEPEEDVELNENEVVIDGEVITIEDGANKPEEVVEVEAEQFKATTGQSPEEAAQDAGVVGDGVLPDGCTPFHNPSLETCEFHPAPEA